MSNGKQITTFCWKRVNTDKKKIKDEQKKQAQLQTTEIRLFNNDLFILKMAVHGGGRRENVAEGEKKERRTEWRKKTRKKEIRRRGARGMVRRFDRNEHDTSTETVESWAEVSEVF